MQRAWLLVRALITLETNSLARTKVRVASANADRGGNLARRRIKSSYGCARASFDTAEIGKSGFGLHDVCPSGVLAAPNGNRGQGLALAGTPRALPSGRARAGGSEGGRRCSRRRNLRAHRGSRRSDSKESLPSPGQKPEGARRSSRLRWKASPATKASRRVTMTRVEVALVGPASVARLRGRGQERGPRQRRQR